MANLRNRHCRYTSLSKSIDLDTLSWLRPALFFSQSLIELSQSFVRHLPNPERYASVSFLARYLMLAKNGLTLYQWKLLEPDEVFRLRTLVEQQADAAAKALDVEFSNNGSTQQTLAELMLEAATAVENILTILPDNPVFKLYMNDYHKGIGYKAYRYAQDMGIVQEWKS